MKVAFIGTHGVGKTTLCYELAARLKKQSLDCEIVKEVARGCPLPINQETNLLAQLWILHSQIARELEMVARHQVVVCDRAVIDNYAYLVHAAGEQPMAARLVRDWIQSYDLLLRVPAGRGPTQTDGVRDVDPDFQTAIDRRVRLLLADWKIDHLDLEGLPRKRWIAVAERAVTTRLGGRKVEIEENGDEESAASQLPLFGSR
ncbi:MAG: ATP-binding protein [Thermoanaerobaculia bacterium]